ncbi:chemotaxis protein CheA [Oceanidesulfovibrio marinus]|uniref:Chemotaxis protein CheA n=1 Tax=Oceanidesulfovibrio marinus TaxID=370038 RepID=A0ABX6ND70_9BACT|nr:chemotaxis protein CheA [Oceanidesulfovibrio marinus]QJT08286.1 chemotaxis protein CheA [Oceanidesulfovibrio marinus]
MTQDDINRQAFREEATELLTELESALLELEENPDDHDLVDRVFRAMHTVKGSGAMFGFDDIAAFTHDVETVFDHVRNGQMAVTKELLDLTLAARDTIAYLLDCADTGDAVDLERTNAVTVGLRALVPGSIAQDNAEATAAAEPQDVEESTPATFRIRFRPEESIFYSGTNPLSLIVELSELGACHTYAHMENVPELEEIDPERCYAWWDVILTTTHGLDAIRDVFIFVEDDCDLKIETIDQDGDFDDRADYKLLGEILVERGDLAPADLERVLQERQPLGEVLTSSGVVSKQNVEAALAEQKAVRDIRKGRTKPEVTEAASSIRVAADKLDQLVDLVGELVIVQARISQVVSERRDPLLTTLSEELERLSDELRDSTLNIRMLPIGTTFSKFRRLVRDLSDELGKKIELVTHGAETELDKTVIERLNDPLVHLLRNSIDHGIETPDKRTAAGKEEAGTIVLSAQHSGGEVHIRIEDDGKGMEPKAIFQKAVERGIVSADAELSDKECYSLIFQPGFSTAEKVTNVSGRGVGMDVVKRSIESLRGSVDVESAPGKGTVITVRLPLTLAIIDGLQVRVADEYFVIPLTMVEECVELMNRADDAAKLQASGNGSEQQLAVRPKAEQRIVNLRGEIVPYIRLREWFESPGDRPAIEQIVVAGVDGTRVGIVVDTVIGEHQTVIKSLGRLYRNVEGISGATIKGDGTMALILDVPKLVQCVNREQ